MLLRAHPFLLNLIAAFNFSQYLQYEDSNCTFYSTNYEYRCLACEDDRQTCVAIKGKYQTDYDGNNVLSDSFKLCYGNCLYDADSDSKDCFAVLMKLQDSSITQCSDFTTVWGGASCTNATLIEQEFVSNSAQHSYNVCAQDYKCVGPSGGGICESQLT
jgi:hypothetical protein